MKRSALCVAGLVALLVFTGCRDREARVPLAYSPDFVRLVQADRVSHVEIVADPAGAACLRGEMTGTPAPGGHPDFTANGPTGAGPITKFEVKLASHERDVEQLLADKKVPYRIVHAQPPFVPWANGLALLVYGVVPVGLVVFVLWLAVRLVRAVERIAKNTEKK
jgi:hypothetical protein